MEFFNEVKNSYFSCMQNIINQMVLDDEEFDSERILEVFSSNAFNISGEDSINSADPFLSELFEPVSNIKSVMLINEQNGKYAPSIGATMPILLTTIEKRYIRTLLDDKGFCNCLGSELEAKLVKSLSDVKPFPWKEHCIFQGIREDADSLGDPEMAEKVKTIIHAIVEKKSLVTSDGQNYNNVDILPYRILYSSKNGIFQLIFLADGMEYAKLLKINKLTQVVIRDACIEQQELAATLIDNRKQMGNPLVLEVKNIYGSLERCFSLFNYYHKEAYYDEAKDRHILKLFYYDFDKSELIRDILSLGDAVVVKYPEDIRNIVIEKIKMAFSYRF